MHTVSAEQIAAHVESMITESASILRPDVLAAIEQAARTERSPQGKTVLMQLLENAQVASTDDVPLCQDTGTVWVRLEVDEGVMITGALAHAIDAAVANAYRNQGLRMSVVRDALVDRTNTLTNTPAFIDMVPVAVSDAASLGVTVHVMLKGAGSDNASRVEMCTPDEGFAGVKRIVISAIEAKASMACPPLIVGVGVGATFDKVASLAKKALLRPVNTPHKDARIAEFERDLLEAINQTGFGPAGIGGDTTALGVAIETAPTHIAALPVAVNLGCSALRSRTRRIEAHK